MKTGLSLAACAACAILLLTGCSGKTRAEADAEVRALLDNGALVVDVRTDAEFKRGHFPGAKHIPLQSIKARGHELGPKDGPVVLYCASGGRSGAALEILKALGYTRAVNAGGLRDMWRIKQAR